MSNTKNMTKGNPLGLLLTFSIPLMFGNIFQQFYTVVDTAIVGRGVGMDALAALGSVDWLNWMSVALVQGFTHGFSVRMSQRFGAGDSEGLKKTAGHSARLTVIIVLVCTALSQAALPLFFNVIRVPQELRPQAELYTRIIFSGLFAVGFYDFCASSLRAVGDSRTPLIAMIISSFINILLDIITVFVFGWGIAGAAVSTVLSQLVSGIICAVKMRRSDDLKFGRKHAKRDLRSEGSLFSIGLPVALQNVVIAIGGIAVQTVVNGFSLPFIAGFTATNKLYGLLDIAAISYGYAVMTYVGQNYGAGKTDRIKSGVRAAVLLALATCAAVSSTMIIFGRKITGIFIASDNAEFAREAGNTAYSYLLVMSIFLVILYMLYIYRAAIQGLGNTLIPLISGIAELSLRVAVAVFIGYTGYENGIFCAEAAAWTAAAVLLVISYYVIVSKLKNGIPATE